jgi:hypothetical protein
VKDPKTLTRAEIIRAANDFKSTRKMSKWTVFINTRELPARPLVLEAAGVAPNDPTNSHQAVAILERLGFETRYAKDTSESREPEPDVQERSSEPVAEVILRIAQGVPDSEWAKVPSDLSKNVDRYLYAKRRGK